MCTSRKTPGVLILKYFAYAGDELGEDEHECIKDCDPIKLHAFSDFHA